ncbi:A/G-specific adenine glycosylase [Hydrogenophaga sp. NFH-34]|uniref:A/G-specific adenine glycosylase n=1 Tax=Hydrogenophaga sp. NFH-34 TaxID=2744446 RepID=UPI003FA37821
MRAGVDAPQVVDDDLPSGFSQRLIDWQRQHGRHGLPWQGSRDPYRVWLSEIMLQQTQVTTVLGYYPRFLARFPDVRALADAPADDVMALWSGLGYYSRARNLHRCAQEVVARHGGVFPRHSTELATLPGIGASTAAAIAAFCFGERISILDGNVRRVLTRLLAFDADLSASAHQKRLWALAQAMLPPAPTGDDMAAYTQGLMDLGASLCHRTRPQCETCPVQPLCRGHAQGQPTRYPVVTRKTLRRHESWWLAVLWRQRPPAEGTEGRQVWLEPRPGRGIWAGLYCTPVHADEASVQAALPAVRSWEALEPVAHSLTHRELRLHPLWAEWPGDAAPSGSGRWVAWADLASVGVPAPVRSLLASLAPGG